MSAFFAMIWEAENMKAAEQAGVIETRLHHHLGRSVSSCTAEGLRVYDLHPASTSPGLIELRPVNSQPSGAVFGTLFKNRTDLVAGPPLTQFDPSDSAHLMTSAGSALISDFWGSYVAVLRTPQGVAVLADPTSSIPCFYSNAGNVTLVFSHLEACEFLDRTQFSINYDFIRALLVYDKIQNGQTGLNEVHELAGGHRLTVTRQGLHVEQLWDPRKTARRPCEEAEPAAASILRDTIEYVVHSRAKACHGGITLNLSGGLDSAIVAATLGRHSSLTRANAVHFVLQSEDPSELAYAQAVASHAEIGLEEVAVTPQRTLPGPADHPLSVRPFRSFLGQDLTTHLAGLAQLEGRTIFTGQGGDHLFLETRSALGFAEYLQHCGLGRQARMELLNSARLSGLSIWQALGKTFATTLNSLRNGDGAHGILDRRTRMNQNDHETLDPAALLPEWASDRQGLPAAKFGQIASLVHMFQIRSGLASLHSRPVVHPLISQPLIELCLRLPTYLLCTDGQGRGLVRKAMAGLVPDQVRLRRSKGDASRFFIDQLDSHREMIAEVIRHGELVRHDLLDPADLDIFLGREEYRHQTFGRMLLIHYAIEAWLQSWKQVGRH
ncbi:asparagine synthase C-terminal domain-containing protein [Henriciella sp.]|uniref:asparagine synthase-related protein n=1 Tax=Henriciella sp. TaxID=1968823 RepID=UPI002621AE20|nr:asparagine synthase C-terminal domain-containing protein [Henriciella sp.]